MHLLIAGIIYLMFFLSGAAALMYEVVWVRSLSLIFGGTHLAVTTVLSVFMGGLALGSYVIGRRADIIKRPLRVYGYLELGIALSALAFIVLMQVYPSVYIYLAGGKDSHKIYLSFIRVLFACAALIVPTTLMGGTLPLLTRFVSRHAAKMGAHLSFLYGFNTLGAVAGTAAAGFFLLRFYSVSTTLHIAVLINVAIGLASILLDGKASAVFARGKTGVDDVDAIPPETSRNHVNENSGPVMPLSGKLVLYGIGISGFCALGYEVLWTRILTLTIGTSVYGFTIMLVAFLIGIAFGSQAYGLLLKLFPSIKEVMARQVILFGLTQFIIGATALVVTIYIRDLPTHSLHLRDYFLAGGFSVFNARQWANITLAFSYLFVPAFFMGLAFPLAGAVTVFSRRNIGHAVGKVLSYNTIGAILGSAVSGYVMIYVFGLERSLQLLTVVNIGYGLLVIFSLRSSPIVNWGIIGLTVASLLFLSLNTHALRIWDMKYFAIFRNNQPDVFENPEKVRDAMNNTDVLFYHEGVDSTISSIKAKGGNQAVLVNGKTVASDSLHDQQVQFTLGHLPMLLHNNPRKVLVVGLGTGMTLGATSVHPSVEELTLAEIEPNVVFAAKTFEQYNHYVLDNPRLKIVHTDGRNFLMTTRNRYDVITADPIHPWTQGSGYLYTTEYFKLASERLLPGGIMCQWLPIYELSVDDLRSVVTTFTRHFKYTMTWLTSVDAEIIGSNTPLVIDEAELQRRITAEPRIFSDLKRVSMGSATDFLSYFLTGTEGMKSFGRTGIVNTDDNLYLEFSAPHSIGKNVMMANVRALARYRENILPYLRPLGDLDAREEQKRTWTVNSEAAAVTDQAHAMFLGGLEETPEFHHLLALLDTTYPSFAPGRFLEEQYEDQVSHHPALLQKTRLILLDDRSEKVVVEISAVVVRISDTRAAVMFVDNEAKIIFGQRYLTGPDLEGRIKKFADAVLANVQVVYRKESRAALAKGQPFPAQEPTLGRIQGRIKEQVEQ